MKQLFYILHLAIYVLLFSAPANAQVGNCEQAEAAAFLDAGNVRARIYNNGALFWNGDTLHVYEVPRGSGVNSVFNANIWIAGLIGDELRGAATMYGRQEFWPGPIDALGNPPDDCSAYDQIWEIRTSDIIDFVSTGEISDNLQNWPRHLGAPVIDGDGDPTNYNLAGGDLPELFGDQRLWWIMNDRGNLHLSTNSEPIGLEIHASAHAFNQSDFVGNTTFYDYRIINKNPVSFEEVYFGFFMDADLGNLDDDQIGSDSLLHLGYAYNHDNNDERAGYGAAPPSIGVTYLKSALADTDGKDNDRDGDIDEPGETIGATNFRTDDGNPTIRGEPGNLSDFYYYMQSRWKDGSKLTLGAQGIGLTNIPVNFLFPGDPVTGRGWSAMNPDPIAGAMLPLLPGDRRSTTSSGPFSIAPGDTINIRTAIVWARGSNNFDSISELKIDVASLHTSPEAFYNRSRQTAIPAPEPPANYALGFKQNYPNPFSESTTLSYSLPNPMRVRLAVYDILGREVDLLVDAHQEAGIYNLEFDAGNLPIGTYLARIELDHLRFTKRMLLLR